MPIAEHHHRFWIEQDPTWDWRTLDFAGFDENFRESPLLFNGVIGTDDPNLSAFRRAGGKTIIWHGWNNQLIFPEGTIDYYDAVRNTFHSTHQVQRFARLFMAPGVTHCGGGPGPNQFDMFGALVRWVEEGDAPDSITASRVEDGTVVRTQPLCPYPLRRQGRPGFGRQLPLQAQLRTVGHARPGLGHTLTGGIRRPKLAPWCDRKRTR